MNRQEIAEEKLLQFFREKGVFTPPEESMLIGGGVMQSVNLEQLIHAAIFFARDEAHISHRYLIKMLAHEIAELS